MIFLTVGTYPLPFDRLIKSVDNAIVKGQIKEDIFAQIGVATYIPKNMQYATMLDKNTFDAYLAKASSIISHAGMGTISMAIDHSIPILVMPRRKIYKEHVNDHQLTTAKRFEKLGHVLAAYNENDIYAQLGVLNSFIPRKRLDYTINVSDRISKFLQDLTEEPC